MTFVGTWTAMASLQSGIERGFEEAARRFAIVPIWIGGAALLVTQFSRGALSQTPVWQGFRTGCCAWSPSAAAR
jgi:hypothetical protein